ncbi:MAG TPA: LamG-like jellyroll fold domain-containing protein [Pyrinomonadaceae bacterium]|nr:LamG-like jellyroll fold domain-containing protein [Pyrinomonadaceae bacterium]
MKLANKALLISVGLALVLTMFVAVCGSLARTKRPQGNQLRQSRPIDQLQQAAHHPISQAEWMRLFHSPEFGFLGPVSIQDLASSVNVSSLSLNPPPNGTASQQYMKVTSGVSDFTSSFTIEAWIKPAASNVSQTIISRYNEGTPSPAQGGYLLWITAANQLKFAVYQNAATNSGTVLSGPTILPGGGWRHVAAVYDAGNSRLRLYVDGHQVASTAGSAPVSSTTTLRVGRENNGLSVYSGLVDEVRVTTGVVYTGDFVPLTHLDAATGVANTLVQGLWNFDNSTNPGLDATGNGNPPNGITAFFGAPAPILSSDVPPLPQASYEGYHDAADCTQISGWAADHNHLNVSISVDIYDGSTKLITIPANLSRPDVGAYLGDNGLHGFSYSVPSSLRDGRLHSIKVQFAGTTTNLGNTPLFITCSIPGVVPSATFVKQDLTTHGNWQGVYGSDGYQVIGESSSLPAYAAINTTGQSLYVWAPSTSNVSALQKALNPADRIAATVYSSTTFTVGVSFADGQAHQLALYLLDWDLAGRRQRIDILDASNNNSLNSQTVDSFSQGSYLVWTLKGNLKIKVTNLSGPNAVVSGLFFGNTSTPTPTPTPTPSSTPTPTPTPTPSPTPTPGGGLVGYWKLDEGAGSSTSDSSGNANAGTLINGPAWISGKVGNALQFNGNNSYVQVGSRPSLIVSSALTMSGWVNPNPGTSGYRAIISKEGEYELALVNGQVAWVIANGYPGWTWFNTNYFPQPGTWTHVAVVYDGSSIKTYGNGVLQQTLSGASGNIGDADSSQNDFRIGGRQAPYLEYFLGGIDEVRVHSRALSGAEIQALVTSAPPPTPTPTPTPDPGPSPPDLTVNQIGRLSSVSNGSMSISYAYDPLGRSTGSVYRLDGIDHVYVNSYGYSQNSAMSGPGDVMTSQTFPDKEVVAYTYDLSGAQQSIKTTPSGGSQQTILSSVMRNARGETLVSKYGNGTTSIHKYNETTNLFLNQIQTARGGTVTIVDGVPQITGGTTLQNYSFSFDSNGNVTGVTDSLHSSLNATYGYDTLDQLVSMTSGPAINYGYDAIGNLIKKESATVNQTYGGTQSCAGCGPVRGPHALASATRGSVTTTYNYDPNGNLLASSDGTINTAITWNSENMPTQSTRAGLTIQRFYLGEALWKKIETGAQNVTTYYLPSLRKENGGYRKFFGGFAERSPNGTLQYYHGDHLGSASLITDISGQITRFQAYMPYGEDRFVDDRTGGSFSPRYQFNFKEKESSGFYDYGARLYNPNTGRWLSPDSNATDGLNRYAYVKNNPLRFSDPTGHFLFPPSLFCQSDLLLRRSGNRGYRPKWVSSNKGSQLNGWRTVPAVPPDHPTDQISADPRARRDFNTEIEFELGAYRFIYTTGTEYVLGVGDRTKQFFSFDVSPMHFLEKELELPGLNWSPFSVSFPARLPRESIYAEHKSSLFIPGMVLRFDNHMDEPPLEFRPGIHGSNGIAAWPRIGFTGEMFKDGLGISWPFSRQREWGEPWNKDH